jgi:hypothetical protein
MRRQDSTVQGSGLRRKESKLFTFWPHRFHQNVHKHTVRAFGLILNPEPSPLVLNPLTPLSLNPSNSLP